MNKKLESVKKMSKRIVVPGELVTEERKRLGQHVFIQNGKVFSDCLGLVNDENELASVVPLEGKYFPIEGDVILGIVELELHAGYLINVNSWCYSFIPRSAVREDLRIGTVISAKIFGVTELREMDLGQIRAYFGGQMIKVSPVKVPRIIGKQASMLAVLKNGTGCNLMVGKNGLIWVKGGNIPLLLKALEMIDRESHLSNLTNRVTEFLEKQKSSGTEDKKVKK